LGGEGVVDIILVGGPGGRGWLAVVAEPVVGRGDRPGSPSEAGGVSGARATLGGTTAAAAYPAARAIPFPAEGVLRVAGVGRRRYSRRGGGGPPGRALSAAPAAAWAATPAAALPATASGAAAVATPAWRPGRSGHRGRTGRRRCCCAPGWAARSAPHRRRCRHRDQGAPRTTGALGTWGRIICNAIQRYGSREPLRNLHLGVVGCVVLGERGDQWPNVHLASVPRWGTVELLPSAMDHHSPRDNA
jgi:hypothetical protein